MVNVMPRKTNMEPDKRLSNDFCPRSIGPSQVPFEYSREYCVLGFVVKGYKEIICCTIPSISVYLLPKLPSVGVAGSGSYTPQEPRLPEKS